MNPRIEDTQCDAPECKSAAAYQDVRGNWCGWHWSLLPEVGKSLNGSRVHINESGKLRILNVS